MRSGHSFPPLRAGLTIILYLNREPVASGPAHELHGPTIHGNGTGKKDSYRRIIVVSIIQKYYKIDLV